jgi:hypothetical protein
VGSAAVVVELYGIRQLAADLDAGRQFWRDGDSIVHTVLSWVTEAGFATFFGEADLEQKSALEYRQRHLIEALRPKGFF